MCEVIIHVLVVLSCIFTFVYKLDSTQIIHPQYMLFIPVFLPIHPPKQVFWEGFKWFKFDYGHIIFI